MPPTAIRRHPYVPPAAALADQRPRLAVVVSDREWAARALEAALAGDGYATLRAQTAEQALALCAAADPDVVFVEQRFADGIPAGAGGAARAPEPGGLALCRRLREGQLVSAAAPVVVTTADSVRRADLLEALGAGAWDLCALPGDSAALLARCALWVRAKRHADRALERGLTDHETGLYNLQGLIRRARETAGLARRADGASPLACVAFRAERGGAPPRADAPEGAAPAGGAPGLARQVRDACLAVGRASDVFARVGVRDFAVLTPGSTGDGARRLVERLRRALSGGGVLVGRVGDAPPAGRSGGPFTEGIVAGVGIRAAVAAADSGAPTEEEAVDVVMRAVMQLHAAE